MAGKLLVSDLDLKGKRVLVRVDFNVPLDADGHITDDSRIRAALPTINHIHEEGGRAVLVSHLGRPKGKVVEGLRMAPVARRLEELTGRRVIRCDDCIGEEVERAVSAMQDGDTVLLENVRFHKEETANDPGFAARLAGLADFFVNDAFGSAHRAHASTEGVTRSLTSAAGMLLEKEICYLSEILRSPETPFAAILGGAKVSDKIGVIRSLLERVDVLVIGGGMAYTFLKARGVEVGASIVEKDSLGLAGDLMAEAEKRSVRLMLPVDHMVAEKMEPGVKATATDGESIPAGKMGLDIGPGTIESFERALRDCKTVVWNGPLGVFEMEGFSQGTRRIAELLSTIGVTTVVGGGDTAAALRMFGLTGGFTHISTGGGASLEMLEGKSLPGIAALTDKA